MTHQRSLPTAMFICIKSIIVKAFLKYICTTPYTVNNALFEIPLQSYYAFCLFTYKI